MNRNIRLFPFFVLLSVILPLCPAWAQDTSGTISGVVTDQSGAVVPQASVRLTSSQTGFTRETQTATAGEYKFSLVPIGVYTVTAQKTGFKTQQSENINVQILSSNLVNLSLQVGQTSETVSVRSQPTQLDTETSDAGTVIQGAQINNLPLNVRQFMQLIFLAPMATPATSDFRSTEVNRNTSVPAAAGQRPEQNNYQIDGFDNRESGRNGFSAAPPVDAVGEFRVQTGLAPAEFGRGGGVIINTVTRGGTNNYHGALYEFIRNDLFDAKPYFASIKSPLKRNQFGGELGGPILHQKLFFFANYEGLRQASTGNPPTGLVPTVAEKQGVFPTKITDPANNNTPFPNNTIPTSRFDPISAKLLKLFPDPNSTASPAINFIFNNRPSGLLDYNYGIGRVDWNLGAKDTMFARYIYDQENTTTPPRLPLPAFSGGTAVQLLAQTGAAEWNHVFSPRIANSFGLGYNRYRNQLGTLNSNRVDFITPSGITNTLSATNPIFWAAPTISIPGIDAPSESTPSYRTMNEYQLLESVVWSHGKHTFKFGGDAQKLQTIMFYTGANGSTAFTNAYTGNNFADYLLGDASAVSKTTKASVWDTNVWYLAGYLQDDWKLSKSLTLNLGLRYEVESAIHMPDACGLGMTLSGGKATEIVSTQCTSLASILSFSQTIRPDVLVTTTKHNAPYNADLNNIAPRIGFAYAVNPKTVVRGGYGIFYDAPQVESSASSNDFAPDTLRPSWTSSPTKPTYDWNPEGQTSGPATLKNAALTVFPFLSRSFPYGVIQEWNLNVQRLLSNTLSFEVMYQGSKDDHLLVFDNSDFKAPGPGNVQTQLPYPQYVRIQDFATWGAGNYNGVSFRLQQALWHQLSYLIAFTHSKSLDNASTINAAPAWTDPFNRASAYGPSDFNATNRISISYSYALPVGQGRAFLGNAGALENAIVGGWGIRGITALQSGLPQSPSMNLSRVGICAAACTARPDRVGKGNLPRGQRTIKRFYDVNAFQVIPAAGVSGRIGNAGRNILIAPPINDFDFQLFKNITFHENQSIEFRWEMYNALNHTQWAAPSTSMESPATFGVVTNTGAPRIMQFALRYGF